MRLIFDFGKNLTYQRVNIFTENCCLAVIFRVRKRKPVKVGVSAHHDDLARCKWKIDGILLGHQQPHEPDNSGYRHADGRNQRCGDQKNHPEFLRIHAQGATVLSPRAITFISLEKNPQTPRPAARTPSVSQTSDLVLEPETAHQPEDDHADLLIDHILDKADACGHNGRNNDAIQNKVAGKRPGLEDSGYQCIFRPKFCKTRFMKTR